MQSPNSTYSNFQKKNSFLNPSENNRYSNLQNSICNINNSQQNPDNTFNFENKQTNSFFNKNNNNNNVNISCEQKNCNNSYFSTYSQTQQQFYGYDRNILNLTNNLNIQNQTIYLFEPENANNLPKTTINPNPSYNFTDFTETLNSIQQTFNSQQAKKNPNFNHNYLSPKNNTQINNPKTLKKDNCLPSNIQQFESKICILKAFEQSNSEKDITIPSQKVQFSKTNINNQYNFSFSNILKDQKQQSSEKSKDKQKQQECSEVLKSRFQQIVHYEEFPYSFINTNIWKIQNFQIGKCLGRGRFGSVYLSRHKPTNMLLAIKQISKKNIIQSGMEKQLQQEIKIQSFLTHPNILKMYGFFSDETNVYLLLELSSHGNIQKEIKNQKVLDEQKAAIYIRQICEGLTFCHQQGIIHRDVKPENILNCFRVLKISDFGWSIYTEEKRMTFCGTLDYVSPEVVQGKDYDFKVDVWSIGILTYEMLVGIIYIYDNNQLFYYLKYDMPFYLSYESQDFIKQLLVEDPNKRISIEDVLKHQWIIKNTNNCLQDWDRNVSEQCLNIFK
ncbi:protein kinase domain protein [Ichthyophthirius multifiliis]|uniref:Aurora kinase n=1 Tax=Ichthyophthirius multifiliis TaxID=5932 RepID=G0QZF7_ICHMU|nr:protein kinase domain protein [Ichthyophthirius multifiliis]EGR29395.1 protein kinase domain protein [Ichthyophthirius multifiliis]|eukprot:XP_004030631.1 protein kinase domain protein [Ichthyophthirius multifiliis]